jgi:membrane-associated protease RseP (regulator of RpoE activity)
MSFIVYDLVFLGIFLILIVAFLYKKRKKIKKESVLLLYKTHWGIKFINHVGKKYKKTLKFLSYVSVGLGYLLMAGILWLFYTIVKIYLLRPDVVAQIKVPPIMPLIPYIDKVVPFLPPFYFTYWIVILAIIAISHEFAHGIFMRRYNIKIKSTGFGFFPFFLPIFLAAFVEQDEKSMVKAKNFEQRAVLGAGTFANVATAILFFVVLWGFFSASFAPAGVAFDDYAYKAVNISTITMINGVTVSNPSQEQLVELAKDASFNNITAGEQKFVGIAGFIGKEHIVLYHDLPAIKAGINGPIIKINEHKITSVEELGTELDKYSPGETIIIKTKVKEETKEYEIILGEDPEEPEKAWLGIGFRNKEASGLMGKIFSALSSFKNPNVYYESEIGEFGWFIYYLLWWLILISISVALVNMLPMGIFDGGRFFYLTVLAITKSEKAAKDSFKWLTYFFLLLLLLIMVFWAYALLF